MLIDSDKVRWWRPQFTIAGLLVVVTIVCVKLAMESHHWRNHRTIEVKVEVAEPITGEIERKVRNHLHSIDGVLLMSFQGRSIRVRMRIHAKQEVMKALQQDDLHVEKVSEIF